MPQSEKLGRSINKFISFFWYSNSAGGQKKDTGKKKRAGGLNKLCLKNKTSTFRLKLMFLMFHNLAYFFPLLSLFVSLVPEKQMALQLSQKGIYKSSSLR